MNSPKSLLFEQNKPSRFKQAIQRMLAPTVANIYKSTLLTNLLVIPIYLFYAHISVISWSMGLVWIIDFLLFCELILKLSKTEEELLKKRMQFKLVCDQFTIAVLVIFEPGGKLLMLPAFAAILYNNFNISHLRSNVFKYCIYGFILISQASIFTHHYPIYITIPQFVVHIIMIISFSLQKNQVKNFETEIQTLAEEKTRWISEFLNEKSEHAKNRGALNLAVQKNKTFEFASVMAVHDINNSLFRLNRILLGRKKGEVPERYGVLTESVIQEVKEKLNLIAPEGKVSFSLYEHILSVTERFNQVKFVFDENSLKTIFNGHLPFFLSILVNLIQNAQEAAELREIKPLEIRMHSPHPMELEIVDNAGGFNPDDITLHHSSKKEDTDQHGVFLHTLLTRGEEMGIQAKVQRLESGMLFTLRFL